MQVGLMNKREEKLEDKSSQLKTEKVVGSCPGDHRKIKQISD